MRTERGRRMLTLPVFLLLVELVPAESATLLTVANASWRYYQEGNHPADQSGVQWYATNYDASAWEVGFGAFGVEDSVLPAGTRINTPLELLASDPAPGSPAQVITYYFRTTFDFGEHPAGVRLTFTNLLDDGAMVYLNGQPLYRYRISNTPGYLTLATPSIEGVLELTNIVNTPLLHQGANVLAVEVHQAAENSSDVVFGLGLSAERILPIVITEQPKSQTVVDRESVTLSVRVTGSDPVFRWYRNDQPIAGAFSSNLTITAITTNSAGRFHVVVTNGISRVVSEQALIRVVPDTFSPMPLQALVLEHQTNHVTLDWNEPLERRTATNAHYYSVHMIGDPTAVSVVAAAAVGPLVRLTVTPNWDREKDYYITINSVTDTERNAVKPNTQIGVQFLRSSNLVAQTQYWRWTALWSSNLPPAWTRNDYMEDPSAWANDPGPFYYEATPYATCLPGPGTPIPIGYESYYFRTTFVLPDNINPTEATLRVTQVLDDGAIFYLNGVELHRTNMPTGSVHFATRALMSWEANICRTNNAGARLLRSGTNIFAAQVHQFEPFFDDVYFAARLDALFPAGLKLPKVSWARSSGIDGVILSWPGTGWVLQETATPTITNSWTDVATAGSCYTNVLPGRFYRLRGSE